MRRVPVNNLINLHYLIINKVMIALCLHTALDSGRTLIDVLQILQISFVVSIN